jgi:quercetin dioxygenase-like cupin family protein
LHGLSGIHAGHLCHEPQKAVEKTCSLAFMFDSESEWEATGDKGVVRKILGYNGQVMMVKIKFDKDAVGATHRHYHTQVTYVVSGKFEFTINGEKKVVSGGDALYMEPDVEHGCKCLEPGMLIDCFSPMRESFLK